MDEITRRLIDLRDSQENIQTEHRDWGLATIQYYRSLSFFEHYLDLSNDQILGIVEFLTWMKESSWISIEALGNTSDGELEELKESFQDDQELVEELFSSQQDWVILRFDQQRVLELSFDFIYGESYPDDDEPETLIKVLQKLSRISRGMFVPENLSINSLGLPVFKLNGVQCQIELNQSLQLQNIDPWGIAQVVNPLLGQTSYQFELWDLSPDGLLVLLKTEEKTRLRKERNWNFKI
jgi:hypothetical protein